MAPRRVPDRARAPPRVTERPLILAVDEDAEALERITGELQRYARDYESLRPSTEAALASSRP